MQLDGRSQGTATCPPPTGGEPGRLPVRLRAWGVTEADVDRAISEAGKGWGREHWAFTSIERVTDATNPLPKYDPKSLASGAGFGWAFIAFTDRAADR